VLAEVEALVVTAALFPPLPVEVVALEDEAVVFSPSDSAPQAATKTVTTRGAVQRRK
jgi:hypothetical protein